MTKKPVVKRKQRARAARSREDFQRRVTAESYAYFAISSQGNCLCIMFMLSPSSRGQLSLRILEISFHSFAAAPHLLTSNFKKCTFNLYKEIQFIKQNIQQNVDDGTRKPKNVKQFFWWWKFKDFFLFHIFF